MHDPHPQPQGQVVPEGPMLADASLAEKQAAFAFAVGTFIEEKLAECPMPPPVVAQSLAIVYASFITRSLKGSKTRRRFVADRLLTSAFGSIADAPEEKEG